jgi:hypothetical protein
MYSQYLQVHVTLGLRNRIKVGECLMLIIFMKKEKLTASDGNKREVFRYSVRRDVADQCLRFTAYLQMRSANCRIIYR